MADDTQATDERAATSAERSSRAKPKRKIVLGPRAHMVVDGEPHGPGDTVEVDARHAERLVARGSMFAKGEEPSDLDERITATGGGGSESAMAAAIAEQARRSKAAKTSLSAGTRQDAPEGDTEGRTEAAERPATVASQDGPRETREARKQKQG